MNRVNFYVIFQVNTFSVQTFVSEELNALAIHSIIRPFIFYVLVGNIESSIRWAYSFELVRAGALCLLHGPPGFNWCFSFAPDFQRCCLALGVLHRQDAYCIC